MNDDERRAANLELFRTVLATISAGAFDGLAEFMTDDLIFDLRTGPTSCRTRSRASSSGTRCS